MESALRLTKGALTLAILAGTFVVDAAIAKEIEARELHEEYARSAYEAEAYPTESTERALEAEAYPTESTERALERAILNTTGVEVIVDCVSSEALNPPGKNEFHILAETVPNFSPHKLIRIEHAVCDDVRSVIQNPDVTNRQAAMAIQLGGHEASHATGQMDEGIAECHGYQHIKGLAEALGASTWQAEALANAAAAEPKIVPIEEYKIPEETCVDGGPLDLDPLEAGFFPGHPLDLRGVDPEFIGPVLAQRG